MNKKQQGRLERLMPNGIPRYVRVYDNPDWADRYTVVFTGRYRYPIPNGMSWFMYLGMNSIPFDPSAGICQHGEDPELIDRPAYGHLGKKIAFTDLPADCQRVVVEDYKSIWELEE